MSENNSLNEKYQKFESEDIISEEELLKQAAADEPKEKKAKKAKEKKSKEPKEKKAKEPKKPKEKKVKEPKHSKKKKGEEPKPSEMTEQEFAYEDTDGALFSGTDASVYTAEEPEGEIPSAYEYMSENDSSDAEENTDEAIIEETGEDIGEAAFTDDVQNGRHREEIVFTDIPTRSKKPKKSKPHKEKKEKAVKEKKIKEKKAKEPKEKKPREPLGKKDIATIAVSAVALIFAVCVGFFAYFDSRPVEKKIQIVSKITFLGKIFPEYAVTPNGSETEQNENMVSKIQIARDGIFTNLLQTDFPSVFYGINSDYTVQYYQYSNNRIIPVKATDAIDLKVDMGSGILNVKMDYVKNGEYVSGISVFTANKNDDTNYFYDFVVFKLTVLPPKYHRDGHALLLASTDKSALESSEILWSESFDVNLKDGSMTRFLSVINRTIDEKGAGVSDFCMLNRAGYTATTQKIPFITSREYPVGSGLQDIFVKNGNKEELFASEVYGKYFTVDASKTVYLRKTTTGFDVIHNTNGEEKIARSFYGFMDTAYTINDEYLLSKEDGHLYNIVTGKDYSLVGYSMNAYSFIVSDDGRYVVMMGTVKNAVDYQIHIFDLQTGEYAKFHDKNYAPHGTLCFIDEKTVLYTAVEPNQGYEYVVLDIEKAFKQQ